MLLRAPKGGGVRNHAVTRNFSTILLRNKSFVPVRQISEGFDIFCHRCKKRYRLGVSISSYYFLTTYSCRTRLRSRSSTV